MALSGRITGTDPADVLASAVERLGVRVDRDALLLRFERHESPQSLKAIVEIAPEIGIEARAFRSDVAGLAEASVPAIVHLVDPAAEDSGFGVLVEIAPDRFVIDEGGGGGVRILTAAEFERSWSGIIVTLAARAGVAVAPELRSGGLRMRLRAWYRREEPLARAALVARRVALAALVVLGLVSSWRLGWDVAGVAGALAASSAVLLAGLGAVASLTLFYRSRRGVVTAGVTRLSSAICGRGTFTDCLGVLASRFSRFAGIDWGSVGVAFFASSLVMLASGAALGAEPRGLLHAWLALAYLLALPGSISLTAVQVYPLRRFCPLCMIVHAAVIASAALGVLYLARGGWPGNPADLVPFALAHGAALLGAFGLIVPYLAFDLESRANRARLGWIGATPWGALAEAAGRPRAVPGVLDAAIRIGGPAARFRLDALVHPMCTGCGPVVEKLLALEKRHAGRVSVGFHIAPRDLASAADGELCAALSAVGLAAGGGEALDAFLLVKKDPWPFLREADAGAGKVLGLLLPGVEVSAQMLARAREAVTASDRLGESLERGTPTLLLHGRLWDASIEDLDALLAKHPDLLAAALRIPRDAEGSSSATAGS